MKITQLEKTRDHVLANIDNEDLYFVKHTIFRNKSKGYSQRFDIRRLNRQNLAGLEMMLDDPNIALVRIELSE